LSRIVFCLACGSLGFYAAAEGVAPRGPEGFRNNYAHPPGESLWEWKWKQWREYVPEAAQVRADLRAARAIGMHRGTFEGLTDEPRDEPPAELARRRNLAGLAPDAFDVMVIGETRPLHPARTGGQR
jgi:hypothetical protein